MTLKYCQSHKCHTYDTKDRKRGSKDNRTNQTRRRSDLYYGGGNFCSMNCYNDWAEDFMNRAIDSVSGRITEPYILTEENAWQKRRHHNWDRTSNNYFMTYFWVNTISGRQIEITLDEFQNQQQPNLQFHLVLDEQPQIVSFNHNLGLKIFLFFFGWARPKKTSSKQGGPAHRLQATSSQENYFYFFLDLIFYLGYSELN